VKIKIRPDQAGTPEKTGRFQADTWLARLRGDVPAGPDSGICAEPGGDGDPRPQAPAEAGAEAAAPAEAPVRAVIGDQLRLPVMWCEMGSCISRYADPAALGEADTRARAISVGWRIDALGRLACPRCQQTDPGFWAARPVAVWDRYMAIARAARITAWPGDGTARSAMPVPGRGRDSRRPASPPQPGWHRHAPAAQASPAGRPDGRQPAPPFARRDREPGPSLAR
jgi:hypothetical protein